MSIQKDIKHLLDEGVITEEVAQNINDYYLSKGASNSSNWLFIIFGILGAMLVGLGLIFIVAHNWDNLPRSIKTTVAFIPMIIGQLACGYTLLKKRDSIAWREGSATFLVFTVGACMAMVSQIYNLQGELSSFMFTWILLVFPLVYVMRSHMASLLVIIGITTYGMIEAYDGSKAWSYLYWLFLLALVPHYWMSFKKNPKSNFLTFQDFFVCISLMFMLPSLIQGSDIMIIPLFLGLFAVYYGIGSLNTFKENRKLNAFRIIGTLGTIFLFLSLSFDSYWNGLFRDFDSGELFDASSFILISVLIVITIGLLIRKISKTPFKDLYPMNYIFLIFMVIFAIGFKFPVISVIGINLLILLLGIYTILQGAKKDHLGVLNFGLLIIMALVICRFFDEEIDFVIKGILFLLVGAGFFISNIWLLKKRKEND